MALLQKREIKEAINSWRQALELAVAQKNDDLANKLQKAIKRYEAEPQMRDAPK